jgi:CheY-like chemotaxis protein
MKIAIEKIENTYDIILMDIQMPEMDGNEVATISEIKWQCPHNYCDDGTLQQTKKKKRCLSNGMNDYLSKPFDFNVLLEKYTPT